MRESRHTHRSPALPLVQGALTVAVTLAAAHWVAAYLEPPHAPLYLLTVGAFLISSLPIGVARRS